jgi:hypothetical protein
MMGKFLGMVNMVVELQWARYSLSGMGKSDIPQVYLLMFATVAASPRISHSFTLRSDSCDDHLQRRAEVMDLSSV